VEKRRIFIYFSFVAAIVTAILCFSPEMEALFSSEARESLQISNKEISQPENSEYLSETASEKKEVPEAPENYRQKLEFFPPMDQAEKRITKKTFGMFIDPETSPVRPDKFRGFHTGTDWEIFPDEMETNVPVRAVCSGILRLKKDASGYGGVAVEECQLSGESVTVVYGHLDLKSIGSDPGERLKAGEIVGFLGAHESSQTDGARKHLHLAFHLGENIDLKGYIDSERKLSDWVDPCLLGCCDS